MIRKTRRPRYHLQAWGAFVEGTQCLLDDELRPAIEHLRRAITLDPIFQEAHHNLAVALRTYGDLEQALHHAQRAASWERPRVHSVVLLGSILMLLGRLSAAWGQYTRAHRLDPDDPIVLAHYALALRMRGDRHELALEHLQRALEGPLPPLLRERIAGQHRDAMSAFEVGPRPLDLCSVPMVSSVYTPASLLGASPPVEHVTPLAPLDREAQRITCEAAARLLVGKRCVALTGAGISAASGLDTRKTLWKRFSRDDAVSVWRLHEDPETLWTVIRDFVGDGGHVPNAAHRALAQLAPHTIITQNVDGLHQQADPNARVLEFHGSFRSLTCHACRRRRLASVEDVLSDQADGVPLCERCQGPLRPSVVFFGERVARRTFREAVEAVLACDVLLVVGCSMDVAPASELPRIATRNGATVIECKRSPSRISNAIGSHLLLGPAEETLPALAEAVSLWMQAGAEAG